MSITHAAFAGARPGPLRLAGPVRRPAVLAALQALAIALLWTYALVLLAAAWPGCRWLAGLAGLHSAWPAAALFALLSLLAALGHALPLALCALPGALLGWRWPWLAAACLAVPQLATCLPGLAAAAIARLRHG